MTAGEQDEVVDECYQCKLCFVKCPYVPPHEWKLDFPRLMMRANAVRRQEGTTVEREADRPVPRSHRSVGHGVQCRRPGGERPHRQARFVLPEGDGKDGGHGLRAAAASLRPPAVHDLVQAATQARHHFRHQHRRRHHTDTDTTQGSVSVFPTCFVEYMDPGIGKDLVKVYERNSVACSVPSGAQCCGAPWLHSGNIKQFRKAAEKNVAVLVDEVRRGKEVIVAQPTCAYVVRKDYPLYLAHSSQAADAALVAEHTADPAEYLMRLHKGADSSLDTNFEGRDAGDVPDQVTYHVPCHLQAQNIGLQSRDLLMVAGVTANVVQQCSGIDGTWGYRAEHYQLARKVAQPLKEQVEAAANEVVCGDCHLANGSIEQETGIKPVHPIQLMARAYGIAEEDDR